MAPISAVIGTAITVAIAVAWIGVTVTRNAISIIGPIRGIVGVACITRTVPRITGIDVDGDALSGCFERHKHRKAKSNGAH